MQIIEAILQKYSTIDKTYSILSEEYGTLMIYIQKNMYRGAYIFQSMTMKKLGSRKLPKFTKDYYMWYSFEYSSPTNRKQYKNSVILDEPRLQDFAEYLNGIIKYQKSAKYQRQLMTPQLREGILSRDHYTCKYCGVSRDAQSHLLLEVDHIHPIAKGGVTAIDNLQSLCWKCNRSKGSKIIDQGVVAA
jgi:predicted restriction endonuclease